MKKYYAWLWHVAVGYKHSDGTYGGCLYVFDTASKRDKWVDAGPEIDCLEYRMMVTKKWVEKYAADRYAIPNP